MESGEHNAAPVAASTTIVSPEAFAQAKLERLHERIDKSLRENRREENIVIVMCVCLFLAGFAILILGYMQRQPLAFGAGSAFEALIIWPIMRILAIRKENLQLALMADMADLLPPDQAARALVEWYSHWIGAKG